MILSRAANHLKSQHWIGVLVELAIVVVGVFIGIQASNWNAAREERRKGIEFAVRLKHDVQEDLHGREVIRLEALSPDDESDRGRDDTDHNNRSQQHPGLSAHFIAPAPCPRIATQVADAQARRPRDFDARHVN